MKQIKIAIKKDIPGALNEVRLLLENAFDRGLSEAFIVLSQTSLEKRTAEQNRLLWPLLTDISGQVEHFGRRYSKEQWKDLLTAGFEGVTEYAPNLDGSGLIAFGHRTSNYGKKKFSEFIEFIYAEGSQRNVQWSEKSQQTYQETRV